MEKKEPNHLLRRAREARGWTQQQLAKELQLSEAAVRSWERGRHTPSLVLRPALTSLFGLSLEDLGFTDENAAPQEPTRSLETVVPELSSAFQRARRNRRLLIGRVRATWIESVFRKSLQHSTLLALGLREWPDALANPWRLAAQGTTRPPLPLPAGTQLLQVYDESEGQLLLLGEPGAGKTTLLLDLTEKLLQRAEQDEELPVAMVFNLSSWSTRQRNLDAWLVEELQGKYLIPAKLAQQWIKEDYLIVLLDGLDETADDARSACIQAINHYQQEHLFSSVVVCCRREEYFAQPTRVESQRAVLIQPLTGEQIDEYIAPADKRLAGVRRALTDDSELREMIKTPLMLAIVALVYQDEGEIVLGGSLKERREQIFARYVETLLARRDSVRYAPRQIRHWLSWLVRQPRIVANVCRHYLKTRRRRSVH